MNHHQIPPAPPFPPAFHDRDSPGMEEISNNFGQIHFDPRTPHFEHHQNAHTPIFEVRPQTDGQAPNSRRPSNNNGKPPPSFEGYTFTKAEAEHSGQKETWACARQTPLPASQSDLKDQIDKQYKRGATGLKQYNAPEMNGCKRRHVDRLIAKRNERDDPSFEHVVASIKHDRRKVRSGGIETVAMQVILKRQLRPGHTFSPAMGSAIPPGLPVEVVDLTGQTESERSSLPSIESSGSGRFSHDGYFPPQHGVPFIHGAEHGFHPAPPFMPHNPPMGEEQHRPHHKSPIGEEQHRPHHKSPIGEEQTHAHHKPPIGEDQHHPKSHGHTMFHEEAYNTAHGHGDRVKKPKEKKHKAPKIIQLSPVKSYKKQKEESSDSSSDMESDASSRDTDETHPTVVSSEGRSYKQETKHHKDHHPRKSSSHDHRDYEIRKVEYRQHKRKVPQPKRRDSSPAPSRLPRYLEDEVVIEPEISRNRREPARRQLSYPRERPIGYPRGLSFDDHLDDDLRARGLRRTTTYHKKISNTAHPIDVHDYDERAERARRIREQIDREEEEARIEEERLERARIRDIIAREKREEDDARIRERRARDRLYEVPRPMRRPREFYHDDDDFSYRY